MPGICRDCFADEIEMGSVCPMCSGSRLVRHRELGELTVAHVDCDAFYASVEKRDNPELKNKPVIVGHDSGRGVVTTACYIARKFGVRSAMPMFKAIRLCPEAIIKRPDMSKYRAVSADIRTLFDEVTEMIEPVSIDEAYLDLSSEHLKSPLAPAPALAWLASEVEHKVGVTISIGLSANKFLAKLASDLDKPRGYAVIGQQEARSVLAPMPVTKIHGVGQATAQRMEQAGWSTIGQLQSLTERELAAHFGKFGHRLVQFVNGEDDRAVRPSRRAKSVSRETTFREDLSAYDGLFNAIEPLCHDVAKRLEAKRLAGRVVILKLKTSDFHIVTRRRTLDTPTQRPSVIADAAAQLLRHEATGRSFRLIGIGVSDLGPERDADPRTLFDIMSD